MVFSDMVFREGAPASRGAPLDRGFLKVRGARGAPQEIPSSVKVFKSLEVSERLRPSMNKKITSVKTFLKTL